MVFADNFGCCVRLTPEELSFASAAVPNLQHQAAKTIHSTALTLEPITNRTSFAKYNLCFLLQILDNRGLFEDSWQKAL